MEEKSIKRTFLRVLKIVLYMLAALLLLRFALPVLLPFILGLLTARLIEPPIRFMKKHFKWSRSFSSIIFSFLVLAGIAALISFVVVGAIRGIASLISSLPDYLGRFSNYFANIEEKILGFIDSAPGELQTGLDGAYNGLVERISKIPADLSSKLLRLVSAVLSRAPAIVLFSVTYGISVFFFSAGYPRITGFLMKQVPASFRDRAQVLKTDLFDTLCHWLFAQIILISATFAELYAAFLLLKIRSPLTAALLIAIIDALPVLGVGMILVPWAVFSLIGNNTYLGFGLIVTYGVVYLVHSFLEPKIVGAQIGLHPLAALAAIYIGFRVSGVLGIVAAPLTLMVLKVLNDRGTVKLWKKYET